jgi:hypothetical protein
MPAAEKSLQARIVTYTIYCVFGAMLLAAVLDLPRRSVEAWSSLQVVLNWDRPEEQFAQRYAPASYALITAVDTTLPPSASLLLVTSGRDTWRREYILYHRLLYALAPRPVWWVAPTTPDGSWKSRWWIFAPLTEQTVLAVAQAKGSTHALLFDTESLTLPGSLSWEAEEGRLVRLETHDGTATERTGARVSNGVRYAGPGALLLVTAALATIFALGYTITAALGRRGYRIGTIEAGGLSWCFGLAIVTLLMFWMSALGLTLDWQVPLITAAAIAGLAWPADYASVGKCPATNHQPAATGHLLSTGCSTPYSYCLSR